MDAARVAQQSTCLNGGDFVRRLQLSNNAIHKYARTMAVCQRGFFFLGCVEKWSSMSLTPEEKMHEHTCIYHHLAFSIWTIQKPLSLLSAERPIFPGSNTSYSKQVTESNSEKSPASTILLLSIQTDFLDEFRAKLALIFLSKAQDRPRLQKQNESVRLLTLLT